ncbi:DNA adenine methylase [Pseudacidovorax intermedius]|uniref:site-specific DNA-methyltransferase (adenine-specific) n=1 Tax=Pseudacidovorax intermedius TaxID=433924 RepID=A0A147GWC1_9BURK|nr:DNA adenine methylase [Pseudacidovorax intermedius]KTT21908.1 adenine methyltransferase [Pseudacidovorax intermedius]
MTQKSPLAWLGGKSRLADQIIERMPPHETYCEVFAGAAWVLFKKPESKVEIINDINSELTNLYRCVKHHLAEVVLQFRWMLVARDDFDRFLRTPADSLTDIQRAARFFYLAKSSFGAKIHKPTFGIAATGAPRLNLLRIEEELSDAHARLARVFIENRPFDQVLQRFDRPGTLFYVDPPYWGCEKDYGEGLFTRDDFARLAALLGACKGKFILSLNDTTGVRETFRDFRIEPVKTRYSISGTAKQEVGEVLITNFKPGRSG